jgi:hypothetical protein
LHRFCQNRPFKQRDARIAINEETFERTKEAQIESTNSIRGFAVSREWQVSIGDNVSDVAWHAALDHSKGWPKRGKSPYDTAAKEAFEEAGVVGKVSKRPIGSYPYDKILEMGDKASCRVDVFALRVTRQRKRWPEKLERQVGWYPPAAAARFVRDPHLRRIIRKFTKSTKLR